MTMPVFPALKAKNPMIAQRVIALPSLADWDLRSGRNLLELQTQDRKSLADWDLRSGRNLPVLRVLRVYSLADWDLRSGRNMNDRQALS